MNIETEVIGEDTVLLNIAEMTERARDARPATRKVRDMMIESNRKQFESAGSHLGASWAPLTEATKARKEREGIDPRPLHGKTGALGTSLAGGKGKRTGATKSIARAGSGVWYGVFTRGTKGGLHSHNTGEPGRKIVGLSQAELDEALDIVGAYIVRGIVP